MRLCTDLTIPVPPPERVFSGHAGIMLADEIRALAWDGHRRTVRELGDDMHEGSVRFGRRVRR